MGVQLKGRQMDEEQGDWTRGSACRVTVAVKMKDIIVGAVLLRRVIKGDKEGVSTLQGGGEREADWGDCCWMAPSDGSVFRSWWSA